MYHLAHYQNRLRKHNEKAFRAEKQVINSANSGFRVLIFQFLDGHLIDLGRSYFRVWPVINVFSLRPALFSAGLISAGDNFWGSRKFRGPVLFSAGDISAGLNFFGRC